MIERIVDFSVRNRFLVILFVLAVGAMGVRAARELPIDAVPDVTNIQVQILTDSPGLSPLEVERFVTWPVETAMSGSTSREHDGTRVRLPSTSTTQTRQTFTGVGFSR